MARDKADRRPSGGAGLLASGTTAVAMFAYGVAGLPAWAAHLWPLGFEAFMASAALNALAEQRTRVPLPAWWQRVPWYPGRCPR